MTVGGYGLVRRDLRCLSSEAVESAALALEGVDDVHGGDRLSLGVLAVRDGVPDDVLEEHLEDSSRLLVDEPGDALDASSPCQSSDSRLRDALDVVPEHLPVSLRASLPESLASLSAARHAVSCKEFRNYRPNEQEKT